MYNTQSEPSPSKTLRFPNLVIDRFSTMTLDILHFIQAKGGNPDEIRESQRKRGLSDEIVDEVAQMYADWVRRTQRCAIS